MIISKKIFQNCDTNNEKKFDKKKRIKSGQVRAANKKKNKG